MDSRSAAVSFFTQFLVGGGGIDHGGVVTESTLGDYSSDCEGNLPKATVIYCLIDAGQFRRFSFKKRTVAWNWKSAFDFFAKPWPSSLAITNQTRPP